MSQYITAIFLIHNNNSFILRLWHYCHACYMFLLKPRVKYCLIWWAAVVSHVLVSYCARVSGCVDHYAAVESEAYECTRNIISTLNFELPEEDNAEMEEPLYNAEELMGLAPRSYNFSMDVKLVRFTYTQTFTHCRKSMAQKHFSFCLLHV